MRQPPLLHCGAVCGGGVRKGKMPLAGLLPAFSHSPPSHKQLGPSGADSQVGGFVYVLGPCESLKQTLLWGWEFLPLPQPPQVFSVGGFISPRWNSGLHGLSHSSAVPLGLSAYGCGTTQSVSCCLAHPVLQLPPCHLCCPSPPLLMVWMNVSFLTPWLSDFHTVRFSGSSGYFLFLNLLLSSFFWLCKEAECVYLCLYLGQDILNIWHLDKLSQGFAKAKLSLWKQL